MSNLAVDSQSTIDLFKRVYGDLSNLIPNNTILSKEIAFSMAQRVGDRFVCAVALAREAGITFAGTGQEAFTILPSVAGIVKQAEIVPSQSVMQSVLAWAFISRGNGDAQAFFNSTKYSVEINLKSHEYYLEVMRLYGQSPELLGYVSYAPVGVQYRNALYTATPGSITLSRADGSTIAFTNGINVAEKAILFAPGQYAAGIWVGSEKARVLQLDSANGVLASGSVVSTDADLGILYVDFVPVAPSAATGSGSVRMAFEGMQNAGEAVGMHRIMTNNGLLFGINAAQYSLWKSNTLNLGAKRWDLKALQLGVAGAVNRGGLDKPLLILVNPRTFANMQQDESAMRKYDSSYQPSKGRNGFESIEYFAANGVNEIISHPCVKEGHVFGIEKSGWIRSGSAQIAFKIPGFSQSEPIFPLENQAGYAMRSFSDQFILCQQPAKQILWYNVNDEAQSF